MRLRVVVGVASVTIGGQDKSPPFIEYPIAVPPLSLIGDEAERRRVVAVHAFEVSKAAIDLSRIPSATFLQLITPPGLTGGRP